MGNFFSSPQQRASESLYDAAMSGKPIGQGFLEKEYGANLSALRANTSQRVGGIAGDIQSRAASEGFAPGSGIEGLISRSTAPVLAGEQQAESQMSASEMQQMLQMLLDQLHTGIAGLPNSSPFGDILAGLTTLGNVAGGAGQLIRGIKTPGAP
jgi:hypothetical protein